MKKVKFKKGKKVLALLLALAMIVAAVPLTVFAATSGDWEYEVLEDGTVELKEYKGSVKDVVVPSKLDGKTVTVIGGKIFPYDIKTITIPASVTYIKQDDEWNDTSGFFENCYNLTAFIVDENNESYCSVDGILFNKEKTTLYRYPSGKTDKSYTIPNSVTTIEYCAFSDCTSLESIFIPAGVSEMYDERYNNWYDRDYFLCDIFSDCTSLRTINVDVENKKYSSVDGVLFNNDKTVLLCYPAGKTDKSYTIPNSVKKMGNAAFIDCTSLASVTIPGNVEIIAASAFYGCKSLTDVKIVDGVEKIDRSAFANCISLKSINIPGSVTYLGRAGYYDEECTVFNGCTSLREINVSPENERYSDVDGVLLDETELHVYPLGRTDKSYNIPECVTNIGHCAFQDNISLKNVTISNSVKRISSSAFTGCDSLESITIGNGVTYIGSLAFTGCDSLKSVTIGNGVTYIGVQAFAGCDSLKSVTIPENVTEIDGYAFGYSERYYDSVKEEYVYDKIPNFTIYGVKGTEAEKYAKDNEFKFIEITETLPGDISGDGDVSADDAVMIQRHIAGLETLGADKLKSADLNGDGIVDEGDAIAILRIDAGLAS